MFVKPAAHPENPDASRTVRVPHTHAQLADEGEHVPENAFWLRRLRQADVVLADPPTPTEPTPAQAAEPPAAEPAARASRHAPQPQQGCALRAIALCRRPGRASRS